VAGLLVLVSAVAFAPRPRTDRITLENFRRIEKGMSRAEVCGILGPPGDYTTGPLEFVGPGELRPWYPPLTVVNDAREDWGWDEKTVSVTFDKSGGVSCAMYSGCQRVKQGPLDNLRWRAKRQWRKWFP
jgi:hypothetical protein